jgi:preprotein translocase subunit SecF
MRAARQVIQEAVPGVTFGRSEAVGPKVSGELFVNSLVSLGLAMILVMGYIWMRFDFQFGVGAVLSLFHDAILTLGVFSFFRIEFTLPVIAALLTVIGYSMNDTVVVFDRCGRISESTKRWRPAKSLTSRSTRRCRADVMTIGTVLIASAALYVFGGETMRPFAICMLLEPWLPRIPPSTSLHRLCRCSVIDLAGRLGPSQV